MPVEGPLFPVNLLLAGKPCLVVGGGAVAAQKVTGLLDGGAHVHVVAPSIGAGVREAIAAGRGVTWDERPYRQGDIEGYWLVVTCTDDPAVNRQVFLEGEAARVWVNSADDPANCGFTLPSRVRQGPLLVTFSTAGQSPAVSAWLRRRFQEEFGPEYATLIELLAEERGRIRREGGSSEGLNWQGALDSGMLDLIREGNLAAAKERLQACLSLSSD
jgi:precorrin-2 dehydrogenase / sirohydrochlorin ferrochelatase